MKKTYPKIKFSINQELDKEMADIFLFSSPTAGYDFSKEIIKIHPELGTLKKINRDSRNEAVDDYIEHFYKDHFNELEASREEFVKLWLKAGEKFFLLTDKLFNKLEWPEGKYTDYISIFPIGPRFLETKEFQTCWLWHDNFISQVVHEMLHFQFFNLAISLDLGSVPEKRIWHISEIFNDIIQSRDEFVSLQNYRPKVCYPEHENQIGKYRKIWQHSKSAEEFIKKSIELK